MQHVYGYMYDKVDERRYKAYITDALMAIAENTAKFAGGSMMRSRWYDGYKPVDERSGDEIAIEVVKKLGLQARER